MTSTKRCPEILHDAGDALLAPWIATGRASRQDERHFAAAMVFSPSVANDLAAARAEYAALRAIAADNGKLSDRPLEALFAAIDAEASATAPANVVSLSAGRDRCRAKRSKNLEFHHGAVEPNFRRRD